MNDDEVAVITNGLAACTVTWFEMGDSAGAVREKLLSQWHRFGQPLGVFAAAANAIGSFAQPVLESVEKTERMTSIRKMLGALEPDQMLVASLRARELLVNLGQEFG